MRNERDGKHVTSAWTCTVTILQNLQNNPGNSAGAELASRSCFYSTNPLQHLAISYALLPRLRHSRRAGLSVIFRDPDEGEPSPDCMARAGALPSRSLQLSMMTDVQCEVLPRVEG